MNEDPQNTISLLVLWDIDGTLLTTGGAGGAALLETGRELFGEKFTLEGVDRFGRLDSFIWRDIVRVNHIQKPDAWEALFREMYLRLYRRRLVSDPGKCKVFPGVRELIERLDRKGHAGQGILSGNYPEIGAMKLQVAGFDLARFIVCAWGSEALYRPELVPIALSRLFELNRTVLDPEQVVIIGDTPHDVHCARVNGCRSLGVATGTFTRERLQEAGADLVVDDLSGTEEILGWLLC